MSGPREDEPEYRLAHEPDGTSVTVRENLVDILERELLGPAHGPEEELAAPPDVAYLVGRIAPFKLSSRDAAPSDSDQDGDGDGDEADTDVGEGEAGSRGVPLTAVEESGAGADEDDVQDLPQQRGLIIPSSMGLRCQVPVDLAEITVTASWGQYRPVKSDEGQVGRYKRTPITFVKKVRVSELDPEDTTTIHLRDTVVLRVDRYDDPEAGRRLIEVALCNDRVAPSKIPVSAWLYQTKLELDAAGEEAFLPVSDRLVDDRAERDDELRRLRLQYRDRLEFAIGRTCSVDWDVAPGSRRARAVWTTWLPTAQTPQTTAEEVGAALLDMRALSTATRAELRTGLEPIVNGYAEWLDAEHARALALPEHLREDGVELVEEARQVRAQLAAGLEHLLSDDEALRCFRFMNQVMADQRVQSQVAQRRASDPRETIAQARAAVLARGPKAHSWRTFQLAFVLMQLPMLTCPEHEGRSGTDPRAQLLFFPTGGGKTEAYLGLAAYTFAIRRRQGILQTADGPLDGSTGVAVLMRYTLRLLTAQQFQRATALVCAAEVARLADVETWGTEPFRIGLWVGTDVSPKRFDEAEEQLRQARNSQGGRHRLTVLQVRRCPWCGHRITDRDMKADAASRRVRVHCGDELATCPFSEGGSAREGLPVLTVDEEIYRLTPSFLIATVDKFARLAREGEAASLFGHVSRRCERHGFVHADYRGCSIKDGSRHQAKGGLPAAAVLPARRLRPPDLVIQDELHLISGALGTTVGLFEVAVDVVSSWHASGGELVRPLLVASTATARNAVDQVKALYGRDVTIFPPQVLDAGRTFFSKEEEISERHPGRRYVGLLTAGLRLTTAEIRVAEVLMAGGQLMLDRAGPAADPYMSLVAYFSATRELAGMARYMDDDIQTALAKRRPWSSLPRRTGTDFGSLHVAELTARVASADITDTLDQLAVSFDPSFDSTAAKRRLQALRQAKKQVPTREVHPFDAVLATSMLQVGVDVTRLGLMLVVGQPKNTAEYIQASSRVGRDPSRPGLVMTLGNWARPRDLAHFEQFRHYHETFYSQVEALSVTPFSATSLDRGLDGVLVSATRVLEAAEARGLSPEQSAGDITRRRDAVTDIIADLVGRVLRAADEDTARRTATLLRNRLDQWEKRHGSLADRRQRLVYERVTNEKDQAPLMISAEDEKSRAGTLNSPPFVVANSMREVQPEINILVSPVEENLFYTAPPGAPRWQPPSEI
ncbi:DISARM system helicase DrmA [Actinoalloteichus spitiensis]|uniref:DISARM system helicase DrmA n=1 Tax=Actinoalloteichus spitiensis TaxID=252394 RepID=UPI0003656ABB|nr:DISARM system helicase DrmA [Actinoalloteichus spitiensis]